MTGTVRYAAVSTNRRRSGHVYSMDACLTLVDIPTRLSAVLEEAIREAHGASRTPFDEAALRSTLAEFGLADMGDSTFSGASLDVDAPVGVDEESPEDDDNEEREPVPVEEPAEEPTEEPTEEPNEEASDEKPNEDSSEDPKEESGQDPEEVEQAGEQPEDSATAPPSPVVIDLGGKE